jgi:acylphosphatase
MAGESPFLTRRYLVSGVVQGVGFRYFVVRRAEGLGLAGLVRNLHDGRVEVLARGSGEALAALETALEEGPPRARVIGVESAQISDEAVSWKHFTAK